MKDSYPPLAPLSTGLRCRCPRCGTGPLFKGLLTVAPRCTHCDLDFSASDSGDGPAVFVIFILGPIVTGLAFWLEVAFEPPMWVHMAIWTPVVIGGSVWLLRPLKAFLIALQYRLKAGESGTRTFN
jgi:uncharacterized protein (DUF983 family)